MRTAREAAGESPCGLHFSESCRFPRGAKRHGKQAVAKAGAHFAVVKHGPCDKAVARNRLELAQPPEIGCGDRCCGFDFKPRQLPAAAPASTVSSKLK